MDNTTPIQQAIVFWSERYREAKGARAVKTMEAAGLFLQYLDAMLPVEREFAKKCFDAGIDFSEGVDQPNKQQYIDSLYKIH